MDARVVHHFAAALVQLRRHSYRYQPASALGLKASGRSRLEVRIAVSAGAFIPETDSQLGLPSRGRVGMYCLIGAEAAIFTIFVVAYLFYVGKSLSGPTPKDVLTVPVFYTICLLSSSLTIHLAAKSLRRGSIRSFGILWLATIALGAAFLYGPATEWHRLIYQQ